MGPRLFICEGCGKREFHCGYRLPDGWWECGSSARERGKRARWCSNCKANGTLRKEARGSFRLATLNAIERGLLDQLRAGLS